MVEQTILHLCLCSSQSENLLKILSIATYPCDYWIIVVPIQWRPVVILNEPSYDHRRRSSFAFPQWLPICQTLDILRCPSATTLTKWKDTSAPPFSFLYMQRSILPTLFPDEVLAQGPCLSSSRKSIFLHSYAQYAFMQTHPHLHTWPPNHLRVCFFVHIHILLFFLFPLLPFPSLLFCECLSPTYFVCLNDPTGRCHSTGSLRIFAVILLSHAETERAR